MKRLMVIRNGSCYCCLFTLSLCLACAEPTVNPAKSSTESGAAPTDKQAEKERLERDVRRIFTATFDGDVETILQCTHPKVNEMKGGMQEARSTVQAAVRKRSADITFEPVEFTQEPVFLTSSSNEFAIIHVRLTALKDGKKIDNDTYQLAVRPLGTDEWKYIDGSGLADDIVQQLFPDFPSDYKLPEVK
jgi:hypothetical protein